MKDEPLFGRQRNPIFGNYAAALFNRNWMIIVDGTRSGQFRANDGEWKTPDKFVGLFGSKWNWNRVGTKWTPVFSQRSLVWKTPVKTAKMWRDFLFSFFFIERRFLSGRASISLRNLDFSLLFFFSFLSFFFFSSFSFSSLYFFFLLSTIFSLFQG